MAARITSIGDFLSMIPVRMNLRSERLVVSNDSVDSQLFEAYTSERSLDFAKQNTINHTHVLVSRAESLRDRILQDYYLAQALASAWRDEANRFATVGLEVVVRNEYELVSNDPDRGSFSEQIVPTVRMWNVLDETERRMSERYRQEQRAATDVVFFLRDWVFKSLDDAVDFVQRDPSDIDKAELLDELARC